MPAFRPASNTNTEARSLTGDEDFLKVPDGADDDLPFA